MVKNGNMKEDDIEQMVKNGNMKEDDIENN